MSDQTKNKRGRPKGSKTKAITPAMRASQEYAYLIAAGKSPTDALRRVAAIWRVSEETIRRNRYRHHERDLEISIAAAYRLEDEIFNQVDEEYLALLEAKLKSLPSDNFDEASGTLCADYMRAVFAEVARRILELIESLQNQQSSVEAAPHLETLRRSAKSYAAGPPDDFTL